jgi:hypothetical protein
VHYKTEKHVKDRSFKLGKLLPKMAKKPHNDHDIEKLADIQVSKPVFARRGKLTMRSFAAHSPTPDDDLFLDSKPKARRPEKSKIAKEHPLLIIESDSDGNEQQTFPCS